VAKRTRRRCGPADPVLARLRSPDPQIRVKALHAICPCGAGFPLYERFRGEVKRLQKDPQPVDGGSPQRCDDHQWRSVSGSNQQVQLPAADVNQVTQRRITAAVPRHPVTLVAGAGQPRRAKAQRRGLQHMPYPAHEGQR
jgi:hypothetical protein